MHKEMRMRAAIIGAGYIGRVHARLIRELGGDLVGVCGRTLSSAQAFAIGNAYESVETMLGAEKPDVVHVCSPNHLHKEHVLAAFRSGAHVMCEKPMATNLDDCHRMIEAAEKAKRIGAIAYCYRGYPLVRELRRRVREGDFGELWRVNGLYLSQDVFDPEKYVWHFTPGTVGEAFALMDYGVHWLDLVEFISGDRIAEVTAAFSTHRPRRVWTGGAGQGPEPAGRKLANGNVAVAFALEDHADLLIRLAKGASGTASIMALSPGNPNHISLSMDGDKGGFDWQQEQPNTFTERHLGEKIIRDKNPDRLHQDDRATAAVPAGHPEGYLDAFRNVIAESWRAMRGETGIHPTFGDGARGIALVEAAAESARTHKPCYPKT
jgi:predicted dehydrogenase